MVTMTESDELLTLDQAAEFLCVSKPTLYRLLDRAELRGTKVGRQWRFRKADLAAYLERGPAAVALSAVPHEVVQAELDFVAGELLALGQTPPAEPEAVTDPREAAVARLLLGIAALAVARRASDIHLEPMRDEGETFGLLRYRIDGALAEVRRLPLRVYEALVLRCKALADIDPAERLPVGDGHVQLPLGDGRTALARISLMPTLLGDSLVARLAVPVQLHAWTLERMGVRAEDAERMRGWLRQPAGLVLASGPVGCGKTTVLYKMLDELVGPGRKVVSLEDPVEFHLPWVTQVPINTRAGFGFGAALRQVLRHDPDVLCIGEVRDLETLEAAMVAAQQGHLVLSVLHIESAFRVPARIIEVFNAAHRERVTFLLADVLEGVTCQRLVRMLCPDCRRPAAIPDDLRERLRRQAAEGGYPLAADAVFHQAVGCPACAHTGYQGRTLILEAMPRTPAIRQAILAGGNPEELQRITVQEGGTTLLAAGIRAAAEGTTSIEEVQRVLPG